MTNGTNRRNNSVFSGARPAYDTREDEMANFDNLPYGLRCQVNENATKLSSRSVHVHLNWAMRAGVGSGATSRKVFELETNEIAVFAGEHLGRYKYPLPHVAAGATILRYGTRVKRQHIR